MYISAEKLTLQKLSTEISIHKSNQLKSIAILMMLFLHLFNTQYQGLFQPLIFVGSQPLSYYLSLFCDICVPIFAFVSGYGLFYKYQQSATTFKATNRIRIRNLYINYWIILIFFVVVMGSVLSKEGYPGDFKTFFLNFTAVDVSYNGAWWFLTTYIIFVVTSSFWFNLLLKVNPYLYLFILLLLYVAGFYFRYYKINIFSSAILNWFHIQASLYFCTLFQFMLGAFVLKYQLHSKLTKKFKNVPSKNYFLLIGMIVLVFVHALLPNLIFAPFIGLIFVLLYSQLEINAFIQRLIDFFTPHATNIWLMHMFFYLIYFNEFIFSFTYVIPIYIVLVGICVICSYPINYLHRNIQRIL